MPVRAHSSPPFFAVIGHPVSHSRSPFLHRRFAAQTGIALEYGLIDAARGGFAAAVADFRARGGRGLNVTTPFKHEAFELAQERSPAAEVATAANALAFDGSRIKAENFDGVGLVRDLADNLGFALRGKRILLLGAGGAARGVLLPLLQQSPAGITIVNRDPARAERLAAEPAFAGRTAARPLSALEAGGHDLVINATSSSLHGAAPLADPRGLRGAQLAYDMSYGRGLTPFLAQARDAGVGRLADGIGMLAEQAAESFCWWHGLRPETGAVLRELRQPLE